MIKKPFCSANQLIGFSMMATLAFNELAKAHQLTDQIKRLVIEKMYNYERTFYTLK